MAEQLVRLSTRRAEAQLSLCFHSAFLSCCKTRRSGHGAQSTCWSLSTGLKRGTGRRRDADCSAVAESQIQGVSTIPGAQQCGGERCLPPLTPTPEKHIRPHSNKKKSTGRNRVQLRPQTVILGVPFERCLSHFVCFTLTSVCCRFLAPLVGVKWAVALFSQISTLRRQGRTLYPTVPEGAEREAQSLFVQEVRWLKAPETHYINKLLRFSKRGPAKMSVSFGYFTLAISVWESSDGKVISSIPFKI